MVILFTPLTLVVVASSSIFHDHQINAVDGDHPHDLREHGAFRTGEYNHETDSEAFDKAFTDFMKFHPDSRHLDDNWVRPNPITKPLGLDHPQVQAYMRSHISDREAGITEEQEIAHANNLQAHHKRMRKNNKPAVDMRQAVHTVLASHQDYNHVNMHKPLLSKLDFDDPEILERMEKLHQANLESFDKYPDIFHPVHNYHNEF
jgi:hypothetical protein